MEVEALQQRISEQEAQHEAEVERLKGQLQRTVPAVQAKPSETYDEQGGDSDCRDNEAPSHRKEFFKQLEKMGKWDVKNFLENSVPAIKEDKECVLAAVKRDGWALQCAGDALRA